MSDYLGFIDESGNHDLETNKKDVSKYYVVAAVVCKETDEYELMLQVEQLRKKYYGGGEIKSGRTRDDRRVVILNELQNVDFKFMALAVNKEELVRTGGLVYKKTFVKFLHGIIYKSLVVTYQDIAIKSG
jgi:hypothetical protein